MSCLAGCSPPWKNSGLYLRALWAKSGGPRDIGAPRTSDLGRSLRTEGHAPPIGVRTCEWGAGVALPVGWQTQRMVACPTLETERLVLRPFRDDDVDDYFAVLDSPEVRRWQNCEHTTRFCATPKDQPYYPSHQRSELNHSNRAARRYRDGWGQPDHAPLAGPYLGLCGVWLQGPLPSLVKDAFDLSDVPFPFHPFGGVLDWGRRSELGY